MRFTAQLKLKAVNAVIKDGESVTKVALEFGVSRKTLYHWLGEYKHAHPKSANHGLESKYVRGRKHPKAYRQQLWYKVRTEIIKDPQCSLDDLAIKLSIGRHALYTLLKEQGVSNKRDRIIFAKLYQTPRSLERDIKISIAKKAIEDQSSISALSKEHGVARNTIYRWINSYNGGHNLEHKYVKGAAHYKSLSEKVESRILGEVVNNPQLSIHALARVTEVSSHGVFNILKKHGLTHKEARITYASGREQERAVVPVVPQVEHRAKSVLPQFIPSLAPAPPPSRRRLFKLFGYSFVTSAPVSFAIISWISLLVTTNSLITSIGLVFTTISLIFGVFFFIYSMKYYITLALVLSFSKEEGEAPVNPRESIKKIGLVSWLLGGSSSGASPGETQSPAGLEADLEHVKLERYPYISVQIPFYNEKNVVERSIAAATNFDYKGEYEVFLCDDSTDKTTDLIREYQKRHLVRGEKLNSIKNEKEGWELTWVEVKPGVTLKHLHRTSRGGYKGGALKLALTLVDPRTEFISIFDADFVPYPDSLHLFLKYFKVQNNMSEDYKKTNVAAVQGYQWHVLNKSENWITRGVRSEYSGSYVIERSGEELYGGLKQISGSVYMIRRDALEHVGWDTSITEDFELTLKLYAAGYKVVYTPYIQAPAECVGTIKRLIRQRMRWAEGHSFNVKKMWRYLLLGDKLTKAEKFEFIYLIPYYLQAFFFLVGTISWILAETVFPARLPFWTVLWGWSLVLTNMFALPLVNAVGMFLEEGEEKDYMGILSFIALSYIVVPFQAYAAIKGYIEKEEGPWFRTPKTGRVTDVFTKGAFFRFITGILPGRDTATAHYKTPSLAPNFNQYTALATANSHFDNFSITRRGRRIVGRGLLGVLLTITTTLVSFSPYVKAVSDSQIQKPTTGSIVNPTKASWAPSLVKDVYAADIGEESEVLTQTKNFNIKSPAKDFEFNQKPSFVLSKRNLNLLSTIKSIITKDSLDISSTEGYLLNTKGKHFDAVTVSHQSDDQIKVDIDTLHLTPGKYSLVIKTGDTAVIQDFSWGVLAINTNKSTFATQDTAKLEMAVLDDNGDMVCNAKLILEIKSPDGRTSILSTEDGTITVTNGCKSKAVLLEGDYQAEYKTSASGKYDMTLQATTENGEYSVHDSFEVKDNLDFDVERITATRIYPVNNYPVGFKVTSSVDYKGIIAEKAPLNFDITNFTEEEIKALFGQEANSEGVEFLEVKEVGGYKSIEWLVDFKAGQTYTFGYTYDAPNVSPYLYTIGPLTIGNFKETRLWQIASDATLTYIGSVEGDSLDNNSGWTEIADLTRSDTRDANMAVSWKIMGATPDSSVMLAASSNNTYASVAVAHVWRNAHQTTPIDQTTATATGASSPVFNSPTITPVTAGAVVLTIGLSTNAASAGDSAITAPTDYINQANYYGNDTAGSVQAGIASRAWTSGAFDPGAWTNITSSDTANESWVAATVALRPAAGQTLTYVGSATASAPGTGAVYPIDLSSLSLQPGDLVIIANGWSHTGDGDPGIALYDVDLSSLSLQQGDLVVVATGWASVIDDNPGVATAGYTEEADLYANDTRDANLAVSYKLMGATPDSNVTVYKNNAIFYGGATVVHAWRNADQTTPLDQTTTTAVDTNDSVIDSPSITPTTAGAVVLSLGLSTAAANLGDTAITAPTNYINQADHNGNGSNRSVQAGIASKAWSGSGAEDPGAWADITTSTSDSDASVTMALRPAASDSFTGIAYLSDGTTPDTTASICAVVENGTPACDSTDGSGEFVIDTLDASTGNQITFFFDGGSEFGNTVTVSDGGNIVSGDSLKVFQDHVIVRYEQGSSITILQMDAYDGSGSNNTDMLFDAVDAGTDTLSVEDGNTLYIQSGYTFAPGGNVDTDGINIAGTYTGAAGQSMTVSGNWAKSGTYTANSSSVTFDGAGGTTQVISGTTSFYNLTATTSTARTLEFQASTTFTVTNNLTLTGTSCSALMSLQSSSPGSAWNLDDDSGGTTNINYVSVQDSHATDQAITTANGFDAHGNTSWTITTACPGDASSSGATASSFQRKTIVNEDATNHAHWRFFYDGSEIDIQYSVNNGGSWTSITSLPYNTNDFSVWTASIGGTEYVWLAVADGGDIKVRQGTLGNGTIGWDTDVSTALNESGTYSYPYISLDSSNYVWVGARYQDGATYSYKTATTYEGTGSQAGNTDPSTWTWTGTPHELTSTSSSNVFGNIVPLNNQDMYAAFASDTNLLGCMWDYSDPSWKASNGDSCGAGGGGGWYTDGTSTWNYRKKLTIDETKIPGTTNLSNFVVLVNRTDSDWADTGNGGNVSQSDGGDIVFTASDGVTKLEHEIENYTNTTGALSAWVEVQTLLAQTNTDIYMYYNSDTATNHWDTYGTWDGVNLQSLVDGGLVAYWRMDENTGGSIADSTGNGNTGTLTNGPAWATGRIGSAVSFDNTDDVITVSDSATMHIDTAMTITAWINIDSYGEGANARVIWANGSYQLVTSTDSSGLLFLPDSANPYFSNSNAYPSAYFGSWHHIAIAYDYGSNTYAFYVDGNAAGSGTASHDIPNPGSVEIGNYGTDRTLDGMVDELKVYNYALTSTEVAEDMARGNYQAVWHMNESSNGSGAVSRSDSSGSNNTLTDTNTTPSGSGVAGNAADFDEANAERLQIGNSSLSQDFPGKGTVSTVTFSAWVNSDEWPTTSPSDYYDSILGKRLENSSNPYEMLFVETFSGGADKIQFGVNSNYANGANTTFSTGQWYFVTGTYDGGAGSNQINAYIDAGTPAAGTTTGNIGTNTDTFTIGDTYSSRYFNGRIDEVRVVNTVRSPDWLTTEFNNQGTPASFYSSIGSEETNGSTDTIDTVPTGVSKNFSLVVDTTNYDVHIVYVKDDTTDEVTYNRWDRTATAGAWIAVENVITLDTSDSDAYVTLSYDTSTEDLYAIWIDTSNNHIYYRKCTASGDATACSTAGNWAAEFDWQDAGTNTNLTSNYSGSYNIFAMWTDGLASPFTVQWDIIVVPEYMWIFFAGAPLLPLLSKVKKKRKHKMY